MLSNQRVLWIVIIFLIAGIAVATRLPFFTGTSTQNLLETRYIDLSFLNFYVRKAVHFFIFGILAMLICLALGNHKYTYYIAFLTSTAIGALDEWHQSFIPGRTSSFNDVLINAAGACTFLFIHFIIIRQNSITSSSKKSVHSQHLPK